MNTTYMALPIIWVGAQLMSAGIKLRGLRGRA